MSTALATLERLMRALERLPGVGARTAERLAYHLLRASREEALALAAAIREVKEKIGQCRECFHLSTGPRCTICTDPDRDRRTLLVVEQPKDVLAFERTGRYRGLYHVLLGRLNPTAGSPAGELTVGALKERVARGGVEEVILATNPDLEGDGTALYVARELQGLGVRITRIAKGIPTGSAIEYASQAILEDALEGRRPLAAEESA